MTIATHESPLANFSVENDPPTGWAPLYGTSAKGGPNWEIFRKNISLGGGREPYLLFSSKGVVVPFGGIFQSESLTRTPERGQVIVKLLAKE